MTTARPGTPFRRVVRHARRRARLYFVMACALVTGTATAADSTFLQIQGITGPSTSTTYTGWFDVSQDSIVLLPGVLGPDGKTITSQCAATIRTQLGNAGAAVAQLVGTNIGNVRIERVSPLEPTPVYRAVLRNSVLTQQMTSFDASGAYDVLSLRFEGITVITFQQKADGSLGSAVQGSFNCMAIP